MSRFRKSQRREVPVLNTASLPDLIFTILFFFMIVTTMRPVPVLTQFTVPRATELQKLQEKNRVVYLMVGQKMGEPSHSGVAIQVNSEFVPLEELRASLEKAKIAVPPSDIGQMTVVLKIDKEIPMGLVNDIKQILRESDLLTIHYSVEKK